MAATRMVMDQGELPAELRPLEPGQGAYRRLLVALFTAGLATFASLYSTQPLLGLLSRHLHVSTSEAAWSVSATTLFLGLGMVVAGPLSGRWGRTRTIKVSLVLTAAFGLLGTVAPTFPLLLVARALQGLALAGTPAVALVYLREEVDPAVGARVNGLYIGGTGLGGMSGRLVAGGVADLGGWRWGVGAITILGAACAAVVVLLLPAARSGRRLAHLGQPPPEDTRSARAAVTAAGRALRDGQLLRLYLIAATLMGAFVAVYNVLGLRLQAGPYGLSLFEASLVFLVYPLGSVGSTVAGRLAERLGRGPVVMAGTLLTAIGLVVTLVSPLPLIIVGTAVLTIGFFAAHGVASGWVAAIGDARVGASAEASADYLLAYYLGSSVFGTVGAGLWSGGRWPALVALAGGLVAVSAASAASLLRTPAR